MKRYKVTFRFDGEIWDEEVGADTYKIENKTATFFRDTKMEWASCLHPILSITKFYRIQEIQNK